ncbi:hypothetical protein FRC12_018264, partial [Ceratobasidium sp. 428]
KAQLARFKDIYETLKESARRKRAAKEARNNVCLERNPSDEGLSDSILAMGWTLEGCDATESL